MKCDIYVGVEWNKHRHAVDFKAKWEMKFIVGGKVAAEEQNENTRKSAYAVQKITRYEWLFCSSVFLDVQRAFCIF